MGALSSGHVSPVCIVWWLIGGGGMIYIGAGESDENDEEENDDRLGTHELERTPRYLRLFPWDPKYRIASKGPSKCRTPRSVWRC